MKLPYVYFLGRYSEKDIVILPEAVSSRKVDTKLEEKMKSGWRDLIKKSSLENKIVWDSELYRLENATPIGDKIHITLSTIPFSIRKMTTVFLPEIISLGEKYFSRGMFCSVFVKTTDNLFCFLKKSQKYVARNQYSFVGGTTSKSEEIILDSEDLFNNAKREMYEELNINANQIDKFYLISIFTTAQTHTCFLYYCQLNINSKNLTKKYDKKHDMESSELILLPFSKISKFLKQNLPLDLNKVDLLKRVKD